MDTERIIIGDACVAEGAAWLGSEVPVFKSVLEVCGPLPLRLKPDGFAQLLSAIMSQQVSVASAAAIRARLEAAKATSPTAILALDEAALRDLGLSRQKARYARALAEAGIDYPGLRQMPLDQVIRTLTSVSGIGPWTAEIYAMFSLGRADVFAPGDLALQEAAKAVFDLSRHPTERELRNMARDWSPWRSVAARALWSYYRVLKNREGVQ